MPNPLFPGIIPLIGIQMPDTFLSYRSSDDYPNLTVVRKWDTPKIRDGRLRFRLYAEQLDWLVEFWNQVGGGRDVFDYVFPIPDVWRGLYVGIGNGATTKFDLPGTSTSSRAMYKDGVAGTPTYTAGTGANGRDQGEFVTAPVDGALVTCDFTGNRVITAVMMNDDLVVKEKGAGVYEVAVTLDEV